MPLYDYKCSTCGRGREVTLKLSELDRMVECLNCGGWMNRMVSAPRVLVDYPGYTSPITGKWIEGRKAHREDLAEHGCRVFEPGEREAFLRQRHKEDDALDKAVDDTVDGFIANLPSDKRDRLAAELENGMSAEIVRETPST